LKVRVEKQIGASVFAIETGMLAKQAAGSCLVQYGDTVVLSACASGPPRGDDADFFPLTCDYRERQAAAGRFPGGFLKREGRPTMKEVLTSRMIDRPIRPLFPAGYRDEVQVQCFVLASDRQNDADVLAMNAASTCLGLSPLPFLGPIASVRLGHIDGKYVPFPTQDELEESDLDLVVSGSKDAILMIEGFAREMPEELMADAILECHKIIRDLCDLQVELCRKVGVQKKQYEAPPAGEFPDQLKAKYYDAFRVAKRTEGKQARAEAVTALKEQAVAEFIPDPKAEGALAVSAFKSAWHALEQRVVRDQILEGTRPDGRDYVTLRPIECAVDVLPRVHGSAMFQRGETQALITVALGTPRDEQRVDGLIEEYSKKFMLDYYFPPFSVGEVRPIRGPGRRRSATVLWPSGASSRFSPSPTSSPTRSA
jgi:polyribonucleotide nucleotidyltransferase